MMQQRPPQTLPRRPKTAQERLFNDFWAIFGRRGPQKSSSHCSEGLIFDFRVKSHLDAPYVANGASKRRQEASKESPGGSGERPRGSKTVPGRPQEAPKTPLKKKYTPQEGHQERQEPPKIGPRAAQEAPREHPEGARRPGPSPEAVFG